MFNNNSKYKHTKEISSSKYTKQENFTTKPTSFNPFDKQEWGPKTWDIMHTFSYNYPNSPNLQTKQNAFNFYTSIGHLLPCSYCQEHCINYVTQNPPSINSRNELINWVLQFHNEVSKRLAKETWTRTKLDKKYETDNAFCS
jgi:hypothetical protein